VVNITKNLLILGAGAAGSIVANKVTRELRDEIALGNYRVTVLDKSDTAYNPAGYTFMPFHLLSQEDVKRKVKKVVSPRAEVYHGEDGDVTRINLDDRNVSVKSGREYSYDYLLIATGARFAPEVVPGLHEDYNTFYTLEGSIMLRESLNKFDGGHIVVTTPEMPIACPGAPSKFTVLLDDYLRYVKTGNVRDRAEITFLWPINNVGPPVYNEKVIKGFEQRGVDRRYNFKTTSVDPKAKTVTSADGETVKYDLLISIPPHRGIEAMISSGISDDEGWLPSNKYTLQYEKSASEKYDEVYIVGDAGPKTMNKMGINAHFQALKTGQNLIYDYHGNGVKSIYKGEQGCPIVESSYTPSTDGKAYMVTWTYGNPAKSFSSGKMGWLIYRMYYYIYFDLTAKAIL